MKIISTVYSFLWGDLFAIPLPGGNSLGISLMILLLIPAGIYFTVKTGFLSVRMFPEMIRISIEKQNKKGNGSVSGLQTLIVATATRVGMGNLVGVVAALSATGKSEIYEISHIDRGYEAIENYPTALGADIKREHILKKDF